MARPIARYGWIPDLPDFRDLKFSAPQKVGDLLDDHIVDEVGEVFAVHRPEFQRSPVEHYPRGKLLPAGPPGQ